MAIMVLPILLAGAFYAVTARTVRDAVDGLAAEQLGASARGVDRRLQDMQRAAVQLSIDYDVNFYLNDDGPYSAIEEYDLRKISDKLSSFLLGNDLLSMLMLYFSGSGYVAFESGACPYSSFYGPMFSVYGTSAEAWREGVLRAGGEARRIVGLRARYAEKDFECALAIYPIGQGAYRRGAIVGMIDAGSLSRLLADMPESYGGWVTVYDRSGQVVATTDGTQERSLRGAGMPAILSGPGGEAAGGEATVKAAGRSYRLYRVRSSVSDWVYVAALDEGRVLAGPRTVMVTAILILLACFAIGTAASYWFARTNAKPVDRLIRLILGEADEGDGGATSVFQRVEEAIVGLEVENRRLEGEVVSVFAMAKANFLQALLAGSYKDRARLAEEAEKVGVDLGGGRLVMMAGMGAAGVSVMEAGEEFSRAVELAQVALAPGEYAVLTSPGEAAFVLAAGRAPDREGGERTRPRAAAEALRSACSADFRGALSFGAGAPVEDAFLLTMSFAQAESARARAARAGSLDVLTHGEGARSGEYRCYSIDLEEAIMRAVRSANVDLLRSLLDSLPDPSAGDSPLDLYSEADLASGLRGTAVRLCAEIPKESSALAARLGQSRRMSPRAAIEELSALLAELARMREGAKRSHNSALAEGILGFIAEKYRDPDLGLAMVADKFRMSENYLSNLYKEQTGECISQTIETARISAAKEMLARTGGTLEGVSASAGYRSVSSFRRAFKRVVGVSPSDYRSSAP